jgi:hypothetical protein
MWVCESEDCMSIARRVYFMKPRDLDAVEGAAVNAGTWAAGSYMTEIGKFDIRELTEVELFEFGRRLYIATCNELQNGLTIMHAR